MKTLGIDLAAQPERTAVCSATWDGDAGLVEVEPGSHHDERCSDCSAVTWDKIGIDCPLGWPEPFVDAMYGAPQAQGVAGRDIDPDKYRAHRQVPADRPGLPPATDTRRCPFRLT